MSKSIPKSAVFVHDNPAIITKKLKFAFCLQEKIDFNPILDWIKSLIFGTDQQSLLIERLEKYGNDIEFFSYSELKESYFKNEIYPSDLKEAVARKLIDIL